MPKIPSEIETVGVDLGGTKMAVGVVGPAAEVHYRSTAPSAGLGEEEIVDALEREARAALDAHPDATAVGLGIPCTIDRERGVAINAVNLPITDLPIRDEMRSRLGLPVFIDNDANCAAIGEHVYGAARGRRHAVVLTIGTGIGGGVIADGRPYRGATGAGAELGHVVIDADGPPCQGSCPNRGCVEAMASGTALAREGRAAAERDPGSALGRLAAAGEAIDGRAVNDAALAGDETAREVVALIGSRIGVALSTLANVLEPEVFLIGGGASAAGDLLLEPAREELRSRALPPMNQTPVEPAELGPDAGMIGAAAMALMELQEEGQEWRDG
jgi:glucokinase